MTVSLLPLPARYRRDRTLGRGAYGLVHEAIDLSTGQRVALKELLHVHAGTVARFKREFRAAQELHHQNLVRLDGLFEDEGRWFIAMELVEGIDLLNYVQTDDEPLYFDEARLRAAFLQLAEGLTVLHAAGLVHRDVKPGNVLVTADDRVVLLDLGLVTGVESREQSSRVTPLGTPAYMAPEQATAENLTPAADWYAFGVCLYQALTGVLPVDGETGFALLQAKQTQRPVAASAQRPGIAQDLDHLCTDLLAIDPGARPRADAVHARLQRAAGSTTASVRGETALRFEGRAEELAQLEEAWSAATAGTLRIVLVAGESGIGKSSLVEHFVQCHPEALLLRSRCYENELLAYKAFDGAVENIARALGKLPPSECEALLPRRAGLLCKLFPAFTAVRAFNGLSVHDGPADPSLARMEAFAIFSRLLANLSARAPLLFCIDDLQWADAESFRLLLSWLRSGLGRCLLVATVRPSSELEGDAEEGISALHKVRCLKELVLTGLPHSSALALTRQLMNRSVPEAWLDLIVKESAGHPLFLIVLARFADSHNPHAVLQLTLDAAIGARLDGLSEQARNLLAIVAVAGTRLPAVVCGHAAALGEQELGRITTELCRQKLLRRRRAGQIACFHDRIRKVILAQLDPEHKRSLHGEVATALASQPRADPGELARHYEAAEQRSLAYQAYQRAADKALELLAFARAILFYSRALELAQGLAVPENECVALRIARAHASARLGRSLDAARGYLQAAQGTSGTEQMRLRMWAAQHLLQSAQVDEGMRSARALLADVGVPLPSSTTAKLAQLMWERTRLAVGTRGDGSVAVDPQDGLRLEAIRGLALPIAWLDLIGGAALGVRYARLAHAVGDPVHQARALAEQAFALSIGDVTDSRVDPLIARARQLCAQRPEPALELVVDLREAFVAQQRFELTRAQLLLERALRTALGRCPEEPWLLTNVRINLAAIWTLTGEHSRLAAAYDEWMAEARDRNDQFALTLLEGLGGGHLSHLMADDPAGAMQAVDAAIRPWPPHPVAFPHFGDTYARVQIALYAGGAAGHLWLEREYSRLSRNVMFKAAFGRSSLLMWRANTSLAAHAVASPAERSKLRRTARECARALSRQRLRYAELAAHALDAQIAALEGEPAVARIRVKDARIRCESAGFVWMSSALSYLEGRLGAQAESQRAALHTFASQGWKQPRRALSVMCPATDSLE
jgi:eukaryotic-like serine/threonine-protein kinase